MPDAFPLLDEVLHRPSGSVRDLAGVPGEDLGPPAFQRSSEGTNFFGHRLVRGVDDQRVEAVGGFVGIGELVEATQRLLSVNRPWCGADPGIRDRGRCGVETCRRGGRRWSRFEWFLVLRVADLSAMV